MPKLIATAIDAVAFLILCNPIRGILKLLIEKTFFPVIRIMRSKEDLSFV